MAVRASGGEPVRRYTACVIGLCAWAVLCEQSPAGEWQPLLPVIRTSDDAVAGDWQLVEGRLRVGASSGARLALPVQPAEEYDFRVSFTRRTGVHSIALMFVHGGRQATFEVDAWGEHLAGIQSIGGRDLRGNATRREGQQLENGRRYTMLVEVRRNSVRGLLDGTEICRLTTTGADLSTAEVWRMPQPTRLAIGAWDSETDFHSVEVRSVGEAPALTISRTPVPAPAAMRPPENSPLASGKRIVIILANQDFFYREYGDPREELERAGIRVTVAAGRRGMCRPHQGSGEGPDGGGVQAQLALSEVKAADFDAILFSGGWGASAYQFAFEGRYSNPVYNGERSIKVEANRLINEFIAANKPVAALCNGVSVLAWARVNGQSPLRGKKVCAPVRQAAAGVYNGRQSQPSCRWHPEANGAILSPPGAVGNPATNADDVMVDGLIITGEDDPSAREMGRVLARVLNAAP